MRIWQGSEDRSQNFHGGAVTVGKFDGLHLGHQRLLQELGPGQPNTVITFDPLPIQVLQAGREFHRLMPKDDLADQLPSYGIDLLYILNFNRALAELSAEEFAEQILWRPFQPRKLVVGHDFAFGKSRGGTTQWLTQWCQVKGIELKVVSAFELDGAVVSSGRVRKLIEAGEVREARRLLGRPFYLRGLVEHGAGRGHTLGFPTLNQNVQNETLPALGVYASRLLWNGKIYPSVTNIGRVPTFTDGRRIHVETHVMGETLSAYGERVDVDLIHRLRAETKFASVQDLKKQIEVDILEAKRVLQG